MTENVPFSRHGINFLGTDISRPILDVSLGTLIKRWHRIPKNQIKNIYYDCWNPTGSFILLDLKDPSHGVSELHNKSRAPDFEVLKL